ncbi:Dihydroorotate dehydrogenase [Mannheimia sp. USDA-ARS-USMARC-1261]|uniref:dihydroorotate dehydrogenase n=1 Tax=Mannheimia sp. USDA-ARS-USMARC-1261 TaxID=1432056 RepID=UPI0003E32E7C|nr:dihydroorotate dehydrogenase [Mannheimia sp. USDA-ARS-USMARC-1261]AHG73797.1 Dihydroorotate dehydrogenase [Mannheimia sp. USDA-ARS-USMARC-1261]
MQKLTFNPPLLNTPCPWCSELDNLRELYACEYTGAVTTRTSMLEPYPHDWANNQYVLFDSTAQQVAGVNVQNATAMQTSSLNTIGLSPNNLIVTKGFVRTISDELSSNSSKPFIISVFGSPEEVGDCYEQICALQNEVKMPLAMEINISCPNIPGKVSPAYSAEELLPYLKALQTTLEKLNQGENALPIGIKIPPFTYQNQYDELIKGLLQAVENGKNLPIAFITSTNTLGSSLLMQGDKSVLNSEVGTGVGGMAGTAIHALSLGNVYTLRQMLDQEPALKSLQIIGVGGVNDKAGFERMKAVGADFVGLATALGVKGIGVFKEILS